MKRNVIAIIFSAVCLFLNPASIAEPLISTEPAQLSFILNNLEHVGTYVDDMPWGVVIYKVIESGDSCYAFNAACPKEWLYIGVSEVQLGPRQNLYKLEGAYGWQVKSVHYDPDLDKPQGCIEISLVEKKADEKNKKWIYAPRTICINLDHAIVMH